MCNFQEKWINLLKPIRYKNECIDISAIDKTRSPFIKDYDKIIFSRSFRRLSKKTQVHPWSNNDHIHNRLTHSLEVSIVGRSLGTEIGYFIENNEDLPTGIKPEYLGEIVQAACAAHDIGNPPFGHAGESAIQEWFNQYDNAKYIRSLSPNQQTDFLIFDGNAQGFRVINTLENNKLDGGFRLTYPTIASVVKYPHSSYNAREAGSKKFNFYQNEKQFFEIVFKKLGLYRNGVFFRHPLSLLTEAADDICYRTLDIEDAVELKILSFADVEKAIIPIQDLMDIDMHVLERLNTDTSKTGYIRAKLLNTLIELTAKAFKDNYIKIMNGENIKSLVDVSDDRLRKYMDNTKHMFESVIMNDAKKTGLEIGSYSLYKRLLDVFIPAAFHKCRKKDALTFKEKRALALMKENAPQENDSLYQSYLCVIDFISGMTDSYATFISQQFAGISSD